MMPGILKRMCCFILTGLCFCCACRISGSQMGEVSEKVSCEITVEMLTSSPNPDLHLVEREINQRVLPKIGCTVSFREVNYSDHEMLVNRMASGENRMDIIFCGYTVNPSELKSNGLIIGIGGLLREYAPQLVAKCEKLMPGCYIQDDYYFVPGSLYPGKQKSFIYNRSWLEEFDIPGPEQLEGTYDALETFFGKMKEGEFPGAALSVGDCFSLPLVEEQLEPFGDPNRFAYGVLMDLEEGTEIVDYYETEQFRTFCEKMQEWKKKGYLDTNSLLDGTNQMGAVMGRRVAGMISDAGIDSLLTLQGGFGDWFQVCRFGGMELTSGALAEKGLAVTSVSEHPEKCVEFLNLVYTDPEISNLMNYGIEGIHYKKQGRHIIVRRESSEYGEGYGYRNQNVLYGDEALNYQYYPVTEEYYTRLSDFRIEECTVSAAFGYIFDTEPVRAKVTAVGEVIDLYRPGLMSGITDIGRLLPEFIRELKAAGIDEVIAENQRQYDAWRESGERLSLREGHGDERGMQGVS